MEQIISFFTFSIQEVLFLSGLFLLFLVQVFYYISFYNKPLAYYKNSVKNVEQTAVKPASVSVVIVAKNESENLKRNLPYILSQNYPDYEVIVVNDGSTDESDVLLKKLECDNPHLYYTFSPIQRDRAFGRRKLALTIGIKAAKKDILLFTEADCMPSSDQWISSMMNKLTDDKEIVLGCCFFQKTKGFFGRIARFDQLFFSLQYLSMAIKNKPFTGTYRNIAFRKHLFFDNKGFSSCLNIENGEEVFINQIVNETNTIVALDQDSFVSMELDSFSQWKEMKTSYIKAKSHFKGFNIGLFSIEVFVRYLFYILTILLLVYGILGQNWAVVGVAGFIFLLRLTMQLITFNKLNKYFSSPSIYLSLIPIELLQPIYNLYFRLSGRHQRKSSY